MMSPSRGAARLSALLACLGSGSSSVIELDSRRDRCTLRSPSRRQHGRVRTRTSSPSRRTFPPTNVGAAFPRAWPTSALVCSRVNGGHSVRGLRFEYRQKSYGPDGVAAGRCQVVRAIRRQASNRLVTITDGGFGRDITLRQRTSSSPRRRPIPASAGASPCDSWVPRAHGGRAETGCRPY
jgi:hypothetical protein